MLEGKQVLIEQIDKTRIKVLANTQDAKQEF
jgi:hypothetical protein